MIKNDYKKSNEYQYVTDEFDCDLSVYLFDGFIEWINDTDAPLDTVVTHLDSIMTLSIRQYNIINLFVVNNWMVKK